MKQLGIYYMSNVIKKSWKWLSLIIVIVSVPLFAYWIIIELQLATATTDRQEILFRKEIVVSIIQGASLLYLVLTLAKTWEMASSTKDAAEASQKALEETRDARYEENAPYVIVYFEKPYREPFLYLVIRNIGKTPAREVQLEFNPAIQSTEEYFSNYSPIVNGIPSLAPGQELRTLFAVYLDYTRAKLPKTYQVRVRYSEGVTGKIKDEYQIADISIYVGVMYPGKKEIDDIAKSAEKISDSLQYISRQITEKRILSDTDELPSKQEIQSAFSSSDVAKNVNSKTGPEPDKNEPI